MGLSSSPDLLHWTEETPSPVLPRRPNQFDSRVAEPGPPPIITPDGILLIYNAADNTLFDLHDPRKLLSRSDHPIFTPERPWEKSGQVPNVVFIEGLLPASAVPNKTPSASAKPAATAHAAPKHADRAHEFLLYYGAADRYVGAAHAILAAAR